MINKMKKYSLIIAFALFLNACGDGKLTEQEAHTKIQEYKTQIDDLNNKIEQLKTDHISDSTAGTALKIEVITATASNFEHYITASGALEAVESAFISPEMNGQIKQVLVSEGNYVKKGQLMFSLNDNVLKSSLVELETALALAEVIYKKQSELWQQKIGSEIQYLEAKNQKESLENRIASLKAQMELTKIKAPISGIIEDIRVKVGEMAMPGQPIATLVNLDKMYVNANVSEAYIASLNKGDKVSITFPNFATLKIESTIHRIGNIIEAGNRTVKVQSIIANSKNMLKPNMVAQITMKDFQNANAILIPSIIVRNDLDGTFIYTVKDEKGKKVAQKRYIKVGKSDNENTIVSEGLQLGETVITQGYNLVKNGTVVKF
jgi:RND family efflux transporter MFP subunit